MPTVYCYGRASTDKQSLTESHQRSVCEEYVNRTLLGEGYTYGGWLYDAATSGTKPMFEREDGRKLWALVQPGDKIVWSKLDRAFRSVYDAAYTMKLLTSKGVSFNSLDLGLDTSTPIGRCVFTILTAFAELEREFICQRTKDGLAIKRKQGKPIGRHAPIGWRKLGRKKDSYYMPDMDERAQVATMTVMRQSGASLERITSHFRPVQRPSGLRWNINSVTAALKAASRRFPKVVVGRRARQPAVA